ncbi:elongation factor G [Deinococcus peraridilitoris]|uniref:Small GTP-binding protein domain protein n=1 Tax=Deinococcus peraridilitoris (strain DSM 19664 / LMG 22246 / CIP 109416 / KR-200) TaxID=937777 RepID=L0A5P7_DEIPD|nr:elongation factor G [Deinococcus peraridilitoris]AFZ68345.1 small GTP-binding protein domain protein [Deinococcus peraridilitoris DSM 19664]
MRVRNVSVVGHSGVGKTSLTEALLFRTGAIKRLGHVEDGTTASDHTEAERRRGISISTSVERVEFDQTTINLLDAPGYADFVREIRGAIRAADSSLVLLSAVSGVEVGTERVWATLDNFNMPRIVVVNKMDRERADFFTALADVRSSLKGPSAAAYLPIGQEHDFRGVVDLLGRRAYVFTDGQSSEMDVPSGLTDVVEEYRAQLVEAIIETDDELTERYLSDETIDDETLHDVFLRAVHGGLLYPVLPLSATKLIGVECLLKLMARGLRSPEERGALTGINGEKREPRREAPASARVWRTSIDPFVGKIAFVRVWSGVLRPGETLRNTTHGVDVRPAHLYTLNGKELVEVSELEAGTIGAITKMSDLHTGDSLADPAQPIDYGALQLPDPVVSAAIHALTRSDEDKLGNAITKLLEEDPTWRFERSVETGETLLSGMGDTHLEIAVEKLAQLGVNVRATVPKIPYRETVRAVGEAQGKHKKQSGGHGQYGDCWLRLSPTGEDFEFASEVVGGVVPGKYIPSIEKGVLEARQKGVVAGYPVQNVRVVVYGGSYHEVDSSDIAFKTAAGIAFRAAMEKARPCLLEPVMLLRVRVPSQYTGDVIGDLQTRRARVQGMDPEGTVITISALVPLAEIQQYSAALRSMTGDRGAYSLKPSGYAEVPAHLTEAIIQARKAEMAHG